MNDQYVHITNGDAAAERIRASGIPGEVLPWRESWLDGPAEPIWERPDATARRASWLERELGIPAPVYALQRRELLTALDRAWSGEAEIVLWFEYDLFDQAMLASLLHLLSRKAEIPRSFGRAHTPAAGRPAGAVSAAGTGMPGGEACPREPVPGLSWVIADSFPGVTDFRGLGQLTPAQIDSLWPQRTPVLTGQLAAGARAWTAFASPDPSAVEDWLGRDAAVLPVMAEALRVHLKRLPAKEDGLGIVERTVLRLLERSGAFTPDKLFQAASAELAMLGMGDLTFWAELKRMAGRPVPLIEIEGAEPLPSFTAPHPADWSMWQIRAAGAGLEALKGNPVRRKRGDGEFHGGGRWLGGYFAADSFPKPPRA
ncbi:RNA polymerase subunit sigma-24 [Paenibacillus humicola]|uniref:RNA polymerase subunit sigma-24 n=1 Tax=Paenibacillus humicola TaxID=3110540 RepID=UPI00237C06B0|nr:RNA polymerase subunit sigma-24 [Paenibacillus humicola]